MHDYVEGGGEIQQVQRGVSGREHPHTLSTVLFDTPRQPRTPVGDIIADIEARRKPARRPSAAKMAGQPRLKILYDDFGEPLRRVWVED